MARKEYKYIDPRENNGSWDYSMYRQKKYSREAFKQETCEIVDDIYVDIVWRSAYNMGDISSLYCDMGPPFWER